MEIIGVSFILLGIVYIAIDYFKNNDHVEARWKNILNGLVIIILGLLGVCTANKYFFKIAAICLWVLIIDDGKVTRWWAKPLLMIGASINILWMLDYID